MAFHPPDTDLEIDVSHPGSGYLQGFAPPGVTNGDPGDLSRRPYRLGGHVTYRCFQALTNAATSDDGGRHPLDGLLWMMTTVEAPGTASTPDRSRSWTSRAGTAAAAPQRPAVTSWPTPAGSRRRTASAPRSRRRRGQHLPGTIADQLVEQRPAHRGRACLFVSFSPWTTLSTGVPSRTSVPTPVLIRAIGLQIILGKVRSFVLPGRGHPQVLISAHGRTEIIEGRHLKSMLKEHLGHDVLISLPKLPRPWLRATLHSHRRIVPLKRLTSQG
jgi:hypothetical protein